MDSHRKLFGAHALVSFILRSVGSGRFVQVAWDVSRQLRESAPQWIVDVVLLHYPLRVACVYGKCSLLEPGLPNPALAKYSEDRVGELLLTVEGSTKLPKYYDGRYYYSRSPHARM